MTMTPTDADRAEARGMKRMKPVMVIPKDCMSAEDIARLNDNGFVVVEATDPSQVRFMEPPPQGYTAQEKAAIQLCRAILERRNSKVWSYADLTDLLVHFLATGTPMSPTEPPAKVKR